MRILSYKPVHDGCLAYVEGNRLVFSIEGEKDSHERYSGIHSVPAALKILGQVPEIPDVLALGGFPRRVDFGYRGQYFGVEESTKKVGTQKILGRSVKVFESTHERAHVMTAYSMSPFPQGEPVYVLCWEGAIGRFYEVDERVRIHPFETVMEMPGWRYAFPFALADYTNRDPEDVWCYELSDAGKLMALVGHGRALPPDERADWSAEVDRLLRTQLEFGTPEQNSASQEILKKSPLTGIGVEHKNVKDLAEAHSRALFARFCEFAESNLRKRLPLLITGGCGLNCDWNTQWKDSGLFPDVFIPPCPNDSGIAIGMAADALQHFTGTAKIEWSVYCGEAFVMDAQVGPEFHQVPLDQETLCSRLNDGQIFAWVQGRYEIGPRALGNRSLIAAPFSGEIHRRLNAIKSREGYRPIAPVCLEEDVQEHFAWDGASPYMLFFQKVKSRELGAVTHIDGTARVQTVNRTQHPRLAELLQAFKALTGFGVLCNTSLNFRGKGFINRMTDLTRYALETGLDGMVVDDVMFLNRNAQSVGAVGSARGYERGR